MWPQGAFPPWQDVAALIDLGLSGAIIGKALYTGDIDLGRAVKLAADIEKADRLARLLDKEAEEDRAAEKGGRK